MTAVSKPCGVSEPIHFYTKSGPYFKLSNFAPFGFELDGKYWPTVEHFFQVQKFKDAAHRERIRDAPTPKGARELGQTRKIRSVQIGRSRAMR